MPPTRPHSARVSGGSRTLTPWLTTRYARPLHHRHHQIAGSRQPPAGSHKSSNGSLPAACCLLPAAKAPTRNRTWNVSFEARHDLPFTTGAIVQRKARDLNPHLHFGRTALAERPGQPYPATLLTSRHWAAGSRQQQKPQSSLQAAGCLLPAVQWTHRESNPDLQHARLVSSRWTMSPKSRLRVCTPGTPGVQTRKRGLQAEGEGVEPSRPFSSAVFETAAIARWLALPDAKRHAKP